METHKSTFSFSWECYGEGTGEREEGRNGKKVKGNKWKGTGEGRILGDTGWCPEDRGRGRGKAGNRGSG
jgi:hypothetical protein